jgi:hypothetical protein
MMYSSSVGLEVVDEVGHVLIPLIQDLIFLAILFLVLLILCLV